MRTLSTFTATTPSYSPPAIVQRSPWHSPAPYLFAGLAAMMGLIAFALLILACSYWKRTGYPREYDDTESVAGDKSTADIIKVMPVYEEKIVVIMAGDLNPSFLAMPVSCKGYCFSDENIENKCEKKMEMESEELVDEKVKDQVIIEIRDQSHHEESQHSHGESH